jgi:hypothetical protein
MVAQYLEMDLSSSNSLINAGYRPERVWSRTNLPQSTTGCILRFAQKPADANGSTPRHTPFAENGPEGVAFE